MTEFGGALLELDKKLSRNEYLNSQTGAYAPVILLLSDGGPTDNWEKGLEQLKKNNFMMNYLSYIFQKNIFMISMNIKSGSDRSVLAQFTGNPEAILDAKDTATLKKMIHKVSVRASEFQSHSKASSDTVTSPDQDSADIVSAVVKDVDEDNGTPVSADDNDWGNWD